MAYLGTPGGHTGDLYTQHLQERHGFVPRGTLRTSWCNSFWVHNNSLIVVVHEKERNFEQVNLLSSESLSAEIKPNQTESIRCPTGEWKVIGSTPVRLNSKFFSE